MAKTRRRRGPRGVVAFVRHTCRGEADGVGVYPIGQASVAKGVGDIAGVDASRKKQRRRTLDATANAVIKDPLQATLRLGVEHFRSRHGQRRPVAPHMGTATTPDIQRMGRGKRSRAGFQGTSRARDAEGKVVTGRMAVESTMPAGAPQQGVDIAARQQQLAVVLEVKGELSHRSAIQLERVAIATHEQPKERRLPGTDGLFVAAEQRGKRRTFGGVDAKGQMVLATRDDRRIRDKPRRPTGEASGMAADGQSSEPRIGHGVDRAMSIRVGAPEPGKAERHHAARLPRSASSRAASPSRERGLSRPGADVRSASRTASV